jgi:pimeloyl-ACP methyl ester carboxylesterase
MPTARIKPNLDMNYWLDDYTDPWRESDAVLMVHGNHEGGAAWYGWVPQLARHYKVVRPDTRGFADSTPMPRDFPWSMDLVIDDFLQLMTRSASALPSRRRESAHHPPCIHGTPPRSPPR